MAKIFTIKGKYRTSNDIIDNISKYIDINKLNNSNNIIIKLNKLNFKTIEQSIPSLNKSNINNNLFTTPNKLVHIELDSIIGKGTYGDVYNGILLNKSKNTIEINKINNLNIKLQNSTKKVIIKVQDIIRKHSNNFNKIIIEYLIHLILCNNKKCVKFIPKLYGMYKYKNKLLYLMDNLKGITFDEFLYKKNKNKYKSNYEDTLLNILKQICLIINLFQKYFKFVHGDFKPNNIFLEKTTKKYINIDGIKLKTYGYIVKIIDYGFSCISSNNNNIIVPTHTYSPIICNKYFIDILFLYIKLFKKLNKTKYNIPSKLRNIIRTKIKKLFILTNLKEVYSKNRSKKSESNISIINYSSQKIEYKIIRDISILFNNYKNSPHLLQFHPLKMYELLEDYSNLQ